MSEQKEGHSGPRWYEAFLKSGRQTPTPISPEGEGMLGAGHEHQGKRFVTHTTLHARHSALENFTFYQKIWIGTALAVAALLLVVWFRVAAVWFIGILSTVYFADTIFNVWLVWRALRRPPELTFDTSALAALRDEDLPTYTILCPLYREAHILPHFVANMEKLQWPKKKLDVMLLLEENDPGTIKAAQSMDLPSYMRVVVVPHSMPKTKPKACNYGLHFARGEYLVIYDAEDAPDADQLKKAYLGFQSVGPEVKCLQAKLNYFNPHQNWLTRLFTAEYSLWFDVTLPGLQSLGTYIPLGGTSNHFRTTDLRELEGWDPFNVTEDCDLGVRLFARGGRTAIINSTTLEEANSNLGNWIRQRSRWIKGYMQTWLVHMRRPVQFFRESGKDALWFQLIVGGKIAFMVINPLLWVLTGTYFIARATFGPAIEQLFPGGIYYMAVTSLVLGNFLFLYYYMIGLAKRGQWSLMKYVFLVPIYWIATSWAAAKAFWQLIWNPHYWEKTVHGLNQASHKDAMAAQGSVVPEAAIPVPATGWWPKARGFAFSGAGMLLAASMAANVLNFLFNAYIGRTLSLEELGLVTVLNTLLLVFSFGVNALGNAVNHEVSFLDGRAGRVRAAAFASYVLRRVLVITLGLSVLWVAVAPLMPSFFNANRVMPFVAFAPCIIAVAWAAANRGYLRGVFAWNAVAWTILAESATKLIVVVSAGQTGHHNLAYLAIPASAVAAAATALIATRFFTVPEASEVTTRHASFPYRYFVAAMANGLATTAFLSVDVLLVKHYMDPATAGLYALLALTGKMVFFLGTLPSTFLTSWVSKHFGDGTDSSHVLWGVFTATLALAGSAALVLVAFGNVLVPFLLGPHAAAIVPYLKEYLPAMALFALTQVVVGYHMARRRFDILAAAIAPSVFLAAGITLWHGSLGTVSWVIFSVSTYGFLLALVAHVLEPYGYAIRSNLADVFGVFTTAAPVAATEGKRILVFNWRDTRHVWAGGAEVYMHEISKRWVGEGHQVTLFCGNDGQSPHNEIIDGVKIVRRGGFYTVYIWAALYYLLKFSGRFDAIVDCHNGIPFFTPLYAWGTPVHGVMFHVHQDVFRHSLKWPLNQIALTLERDVMPRVYRDISFVTVSKSTQQAMRKLGVGRAGIDIVYSGVDLATLKPGDKSENPLVVYLGRLKAYKSIDTLLTAFKTVVQQMPMAILMIAGHGEEERHLKRLAGQLGIADRVVFTGKVTDEEKVELLQKAWVMVNPSFMEGWGITVIEANACGTPVIAADVPGLRESVRDAKTGYLFRHGDTEALASRLQAVLGDHVRRDELAREAASWATNFDWGKASREFLEIIT